MLKMFCPYIKKEAPKVAKFDKAAAQMKMFKTLAAMFAVIWGVAIFAAAV